MKWRRLDDTCTRTRLGVWAREHTNTEDRRRAFNQFRSSVCGWRSKDRNVEGIWVEVCIPLIEQKSQMYGIWSWFQFRKYQPATEGQDDSSVEALLGTGTAFPSS